MSSIDFDYQLVKAQIGSTQGAWFYVGFLRQFTVHVGSVDPGDIVQIWGSNFGAENDIETKPGIPSGAQIGSNITAEKMVGVTDSIKWIRVSKTAGATPQSTDAWIHGIRWQRQG